MLEVYECEEPVKRDRSIEHLALSVEEVDKLYQEMLSEYKVLSPEVESLPYWKNGIRF